jgi:phosphoribosylamine-glycine ligase
MDNKSKNILIVGNGAVTTALAKKLSKYGKIFITGLQTRYEDKYTSVDLREDDINGLLKFVLENNIDLTIPVSDKAFSSDIVSFFQSNGQNIFGPTKESCKFALNKGVGKKLIYKIHAQTSKFGIFDKQQTALDWISKARMPVIIKSSEYNRLGDRLVATTISLAEQFLANLTIKNETDILIEEYTYGKNFTVYYVTDGYTAVKLSPVRNYKFTNDDDCGILTNGMGTFAPDYKISQTSLQRVDNVVKNILTSLEKNGTPYLGILGIDCTLTGDDKFYVNEFKPFFQDFDASVVLNLIDEDLYKLMQACIDGIFSDEYEHIKQNNLSSISAVVTSRLFNKTITGLEKVEDFENIDFINFKRTPSGEYLTQKGEEFVITRSASTLSRAKKYLYEDLSEIHFDGMKYRKDIGKDFGV